MDEHDPYYSRKAARYSAAWGVLAWMYAAGLLLVVAGLLLVVVGLLVQVMA